jgi:hypothetical protein
LPQNLMRMQATQWKSAALSLWQLHQSAAVFDDVPRGTIVILV